MNELMAIAQRVSVPSRERWTTLRNVRCPWCWSDKGELLLMPCKAQSCSLVSNDNNLRAVHHKWCPRGAAAPLRILPFNHSVLGFKIWIYLRTLVVSPSVSFIFFFFHAQLYIYLITEKWMSSFFITPAALMPKNPTTSFGGTLERDESRGDIAAHGENEIS